MSSPEGSIAPSTLRALTSFTGFATEIYLGKLRKGKEEGNSAYLSSYAIKQLLYSGLCLLL